MKNKQIRISILCLLFCITLNGFAQQDRIPVSGTVVDENNEAMIGVTVYVENEPGFGVTTNIDGKYTIKVRKNATLVFSFLGYEKQEIDVDGRSTINVKMAVSANNVLDEVVITATGAQKKASVSGAITTVDVKTLKMPTSNITNALAGNVAGVISMQISGEPGANQSEFWIRGISTFGAGSKALVLVDGFERPFNEINIEDIESFSVLKDASATAIYGSRGANGVIIITTKRGEAGKISIDGKVEYGYNTRTRTPEFVDGITYANLLNEARRTRNLEPIYNNVELGIIENKLDNDIYPNIDWKDVLLKDGANTYRATVNLRGGGTAARYYVSAGYVNEAGMYKTDEALKNYNTNSNMKRTNYRMNIDIDITPTTVLRPSISGFFEKQNRAGIVQDYLIWNIDEVYVPVLAVANGEGINIWKSLVGYSPLASPLQFSNGKIPAYGIADLTNPWVIATQTGYHESWRSKIETNISLEQKLDFITKGLFLTGRFAFDSDSRNDIRHLCWPRQHRIQGRREWVDGDLEYSKVSDPRDMSAIMGSWGGRVFNLEGELAYNRLFAKAHNVSLFFKYAQREQSETAIVIPRRDQSLSGRISYDFKSRYFIEFNGGYTGSELFKFGHQFGFFPAISGAWNLAEEAFIKDNTDVFDMVKFRYSYGQVGNNKIILPGTSDEYRFPYVGRIGTMGGYNYGDLTNPNYSDLGTEYDLNYFKYQGMTVSRLAVDYLSWEVATKHNLGLDFSLWNGKFSGQVDVFKDTRDNIYMQRKYLSKTSGITSQPWANIGKMENKGFDGQFNFNQRIGEVEFVTRGNITYNRNKVLEYDEEADALAYKMTQGYRWEQAKGLVALGLFESYEDIRNSPQQQFGSYMPGDIKYKDVNGDGVINDNDMVAIGATRVPSLIYGIGMSATWKGVDLNVHFQGSGKSSYFINGPAVYPFSEIHQGNTLPWGNILTDVVGNYWSESNPNPNAKYPRLSYGGNDNNYRASTYWLRDGAYLRFKTLEVGYTVPKKYINKLSINNLRVYFLGSNLFVWDTLKLWDPELGSGNGMAYPITKSFMGGLTISL